MQLRSLILVLGLGGCGASAGGKLMVDTPVLPYQAPDISEITGIDEDEAEAADEATEAPAPVAPESKK
ncbi:MAG: hypothetical protein ACTHU0_13020 [Kofleriaceae bacterium]